MATTYPGTIQTFTDPSGTSPLATGPDHAQLHTNINDTLEAVQTVLGTTAGTAVLKNLTAGQFVVSDIGTATLTNKTIIGSTNSISFNSPAGFLINGKIVPSVASNNLTVAIKGLDGNDPSATNPVYIRIGDTIRTITAALSVTKNAGTNWMNAGSATNATKERDYFVYLGYNATDGVVIGFAQFSSANEYDDFSTTSTNGKYCAISTITNAAAGDDYVVVGRFAATLSAGAGYTWTVPTFTNKNLIQRPIFTTRYMDFAPQITGGGSMTITGASVTQAKYMLNETNMILQYNGAFTTATATDISIIMQMPFPVSVGNYIVVNSVWVSQATVWDIHVAQFTNTATELYFHQSNLGAWANNAKEIRCQFIAKI